MHNPSQIFAFHDYVTYHDPYGPRMGPIWVVQEYLVATRQSVKFSKINERGLVYDVPSYLSIIVFEKIQSEEESRERDALLQRRASLPIVSFFRNDICYPETL